MTSNEAIMNALAQLFLQEPLIILRLWEWAADTSESIRLDGNVKQALDRAMLCDPHEASDPPESYVITEDAANVIMSLFGAIRYSPTLTLALTFTVIGPDGKQIQSEE